MLVAMKILQFLSVPVSCTAMILMAASLTFSHAEDFDFQNGVEVQPGGPIYAGQSDTYLNDTLEWANYGGDARVRIGQNPSNNHLYRALFQFEDLTDYISSGQTVTSASLTLRSLTTPSTTEDITVEIFSIVAGNSGWNAGSTTAAQEVGAAAWSAYEFVDTTGGSVSWIGGNGLGAPGGGYSLTPVGDFIVPHASTASLTISGLESTVQGWIDDPSSNAGLLFRVVDESNEAYVRLRGSEWATAGERPLLSVTAIPEPSHAALFLGLIFAIFSLTSRKRVKSI